MLWPSIVTLEIDNMTICNLLSIPGNALTKGTPVPVLMQMGNSIDLFPNIFQSTEEAHRYPISMGQ